jgi:hypothetical protein
LAPTYFTGSNPGEYWGVSKYTGSSRDMSFWGTLASGTKFCCVTDLVEPGLFPEVHVVAVGSDNSDEMAWKWVSEELNMADFPAYEFRECEMHGEQGDDVLTGPLAGDGLGSVLYAGGAGNDRIYMAGTKAEAHGGLGNDKIRGTVWIDHIYGESPGANPFIGGSDILAGGGLNDEIYGGAGSDRICGEGGEDLVFGGSGNDTIAAGGDPWDDVEGGSGTDACDPLADCEGGLLGPVNCSF